MLRILCIILFRISLTLHVYIMLHIQLIPKHIATVDREKFVVKKISYQPFFNEIKAHEIFLTIIFN